MFFWEVTSVGGLVREAMMDSSVSLSEAEAGRACVPAGRSSERRAMLLWGRFRGNGELGQCWMRECGLGAGIDARSRNTGRGTGLYA